jgi:predicted RNA-binding protein with PUA-like domain
MANYWLLKTEPTTYAFEQLAKEGKAVWDGVRNNLALKYMREMQPGDHVMIYHSGAQKAVVGQARVLKAAYADPKQDDAKLVVVDLAPAGALSHPVTLAQIKAEASLAELPLVRMPRLSVMPVPAPAWKTILGMAAK